MILWDRDRPAFEHLFLNLALCARLILHFRVFEHALMSKIDKLVPRQGDSTSCLLTRHFSYNITIDAQVLAYDFFWHDTRRLMWI